MSVVETPFPNRPDLGIKVLLERGPIEALTEVQRKWAGQDLVRWKWLAILHLYVYADWSVGMIARVFGHPKGHVSRVLKTVKRELAERFMPETEDAIRRHAQIDEEPEEEDRDPAG